MTQNPETWYKLITQQAYYNQRAIMRLKLFLLVICISIFSEVCRANPLAGSPAIAQKPLNQQSLFLTPPRISPNPVGRAPLIAIVTFITTDPVQVTIEVDDGEHRWQQNRSHFARQHRVPIVGMRPNRFHRIQIRLLDSQGTTIETSYPLVFKTPALPVDFPPLTTSVTHPDLMEPGVTLFPVTTWLNDTSTMNYGYLVAVDNTGDVVWYLNTGSRMNDVRVLSNGHILYIHATFRYALEVDICGNVIRQWHASATTTAPSYRSIPIYIDSIHHDLVELPNGEFLTLSSELRQSDSFPRSVTNPNAGLGSAYVVCDKVVSFRRHDGWITHSIPLYEKLDHQQFGYLSLLDFWTKHYDEAISGKCRDWSHANGLAYDASDDTVIVSVRHLDCLIKLGRQDGRIHWMLGDPKGWGEPWQKYFLQPSGDLTWPCHQHAPRITDRGTLMLYDNGNFRAKPYERKTLAANNASRVVEFQIDEKARTVKQVWEYRGENGETFYCPFYCEADLLPNTRNILVTDGGHVESDAGVPQDVVPSQRQWARIFELRRKDNTTQKVFEIVVDSGKGSRVGWSIYRSTRLPSLQDLACDTNAPRRSR